MTAKETEPPPITNGNGTAVVKTANGNTVVVRTNGNGKVATGVTIPDTNGNGVSPVTDSGITQVPMSAEKPKSNKWKWIVAGVVALGVVVWWASRKHAPVSGLEVTDDQ